MALMLAAMHPERVQSLVLYGTYARRTRAEDYPWAQSQEARETYVDQLVTRWDWEADLLMRCPSGDEAMQRWWSHRIRAAATPGTIRALMDMNALVDVRDLLPNIGVPTLVLHRSGDAMFSVEEAHYLAGRIPGATLVELSGTDHFVSGDPDQILDAIEPFVSAVPKPTHRFALAAVLFPTEPGTTDVVQALVEDGGRRRHTAAGDVVVLFDGPATAVRAALAAMEGDGDARLGLAIAEVAVDGGALTGQGVELAVRLGNAAAPGELLVSSTAAVLLASAEVALRPLEGNRATPEGTLMIRKDRAP
jgi:hypothetical protein